MFRIHQPHLYLTTCLLLCSALMQASSGPASHLPVAHTVYTATHEHGEITVLHLQEQTDAFKALFQLYEFELVPHTQKEVMANGQYDQDLWSPHGHDLYLLLCGTTPVGFAVVNHSSMITGNPEVRDIAEFFVLPSHRRLHLGQAFAHNLFARYPGAWEVRQLPELHQAYAFWKRTIAAYVGDNFYDTSMNNEGWVGTVQEFVSPRFSCPLQAKIGLTTEQSSPFLRSTKAYS